MARAFNISISRRSGSALRGDRPVGFRPPVAEELPHFAYFGDHLEIEIGNYDFVFITTGLSDDLSPRIAKIAFAIEFADAPRLLGPHTINRAHKIAFSHGMSRLLQFPQIFRETCDSGGRVEHDLRAIQSENARTFREVAVIADVHPHASIFSFENWIAEIPGSEIKLFPESRMAVRQMMLAVLAEIAAVGVDDRGRVEVDPGHLLFVDRDDNHHVMLCCNLLHQLRGRPVGYAFGHVIPTRVLLRAEIRSVKKFLQA